MSHNYNITKPCSYRLHTSSTGRHTITVDRVSNNNANATRYIPQDSTNGLDRQPRSRKNRGAWMTGWIWNWTWGRFGSCRTLDGWCGVWFCCFWRRGLFGGVKVKVVQTGLHNSVALLGLGWWATHCNSQDSPPADRPGTVALADAAAPADRTIPCSVRCRTTWPAKQMPRQS